MKKLGILVLLLFSMFSCKKDPNAESIQKIDALLVQVDEANEALAKLNPEKYLPYLDTINFDVKFIQQEYTDTMSLEIGSKVEGYYRMAKSISKFESTYKDQKKDIKYSKKQLSNLKADLEVGVLDSNLLAMYLPAETEAVKRIKESNKSLKIWHQSVETGYRKQRPFIDSLILKIKEKQGY